MDILLPFTLQNPVIFEGWTTLCLCHFRPKHRIDEKMEAEIYRHRGRAITKLRDRMADLSLQADDASILTVTSLTASEVCEALDERRSSSDSDQGSAITGPQ